jgi:hypothetical protein
LVVIKQYLDSRIFSGATEEYDGSTWTTSPASLATARNLGGAGTQTAALAFGGYSPTTATEEWTGAGQQ